MIIRFQFVFWLPAMCILASSCTPLELYGNTVWHQGPYRSGPGVGPGVGPGSSYSSQIPDRPRESRGADSYGDPDYDPPKAQKSTFRSMLETSNELRLAESKMMLRQKKAQAAQGDSEAQEWVDEWEPKIKAAERFHEEGKAM